MRPSINPTKVQVYYLPDTVVEHDFRGRAEDKENGYELLATARVQPVWYSHEEIRQLESMDRKQSSGYFIMKNNDLSRLNINPSPDGGTWNRYRFKFNINNQYSSSFLEIVEMRPESPYRGYYRLWYAYFREVRPEPYSSTEQAPKEKVDDTQKGLDLTKSVVRRNE